MGRALRFCRPLAGMGSAVVGVVGLPSHWELGELGVSEGVAVGLWAFAVIAVPCPVATAPVGAGSVAVAGALPITDGVDRLAAPVGSTMVLGNECQGGIVLGPKGVAARHKAAKSDAAFKRAP